MSGPLRQRLMVLFACLSVFAAPSALAGSLEGKVVTRDGPRQRPVAGAEVRVVVVPPGTIGYGGDAQGRAQVLATDKRGRFKLDEVVTEGDDGAVRRAELAKGSMLRVKILSTGLPSVEKELIYVGGNQRQTFLILPAPRLVVRVLGEDDRGLETPLPNVRVFLTPTTVEPPDPIEGLHAVGVTNAEGVALLDELVPVIPTSGAPAEPLALLEGRDYVVEVRAPAHYVLRGAARVKGGYQGLELVLVPRNSTTIEDRSGVIRANDKLLETGSVRRGD